MPLGFSSQFGKLILELWAHTNYVPYLTTLSVNFKYVYGRRDVRGFREELIMKKEE
jgi:hypothetical protein